MPSTIPYSPSLTLGSVITPSVMEALIKISQAQAPIDAAQENLSSLISLRRSLDMTRQELVDMRISPAELDASLIKVNADIDAAASHYAAVRMAQEDALLELRSGMPPVMAGPESPVDFNYERTQIKQVAIGADNLKLEVQYFSFNENAQDAHSVGPEQGDAFASRYHDGSDRLARVIVIRPGWAATAAVLVVACALGFAYLAKHTRLLLDTADLGADGSRPRLSLAKVQFALWFFAIFTSFLVIWLTTGRTDSLNSSVLAILGISSGTALGESFLRNANGATSAQRTERQADPSRPPAQFWAQMKDLACDAHGASIYRFQALAWTAVLLVTFASQVYFDLSMPVFGSELLYLLGLSSGTYIAQGVPGTGKWHAPVMPPPASAAPPGMPSPDTTTSPPQDTGKEANARLAGLAQRMRSAEADQPRAPP